MERNNFFEDMRSALRRRSVDESRIDEVLSLVSEDDNEPNLLKMENDCWQRLEEMNLLEEFERACREIGINEWNHDNNLPRA